MKKLFLLAILLSAAGNLFAQRVADEGVDAFAHTASQLASLFKDKTRDEVVRAVQQVPSYENTLTAAQGTQYNVVRYGKLTEEYRLFLFKSGSRPVLLAVAENAPAVLALNKKYRLLLPLAEQELARRMPQAFMTVVPDVARNTQYRVYQNGEDFYLFEKGVLVRSFENAQNFSAFMSAITASNSAVTAQQAQAQTAWEQAQTEQGANAPRYYYNSWGGIVVGGPGYAGYRRLHRHPRTKESPAFAPLTPSGPPAGTVLIRDIDGKYMNYK